MYQDLWFYSVHRLRLRNGNSDDLYAVCQDATAFSLTVFELDQTSLFVKLHSKNLQVKTQVFVTLHQTSINSISLQFLKMLPTLLVKLSHRRIETRS